MEENGKVYELGERQDELVVALRNGGYRVEPLTTEQNLDIINTNAVMVGTIDTEIKDVRTLGDPELEKFLSEF